MAKHKRKRFLSILVTAVLVFTLALSSVMAQDDEHVRTDKLSVEGEGVEVIAGIVGEDDADVVADEAIASDDAETEEPDADEATEETEEELPAGEVTEEAVADVPDAAEDDAEADAGIMTLSVGDIEDEDDYGIQTLADGDVTLISGSTETSYASITEALEDVTGESDVIRLNNDVEEPVRIPTSTTVTLDLNGKTLDVGKDSNSVIIVRNDSTLTIKDSSGNNSGKITGAYNMNHGGGVELQNNATVNLEGGTISGNAVNTAGGGVAFDGTGSTFNMSGGVITDNSSASGGGVYVDAGNTFNMSGGEISGNTASNNGSGVYVGNGSTFTMTGGVITKNEAIQGSGDEYGNGGGVLVALGGTFVLDGGTITENKALHGGGVVSAGTFTMKSGTISGNETTNGGSGGGVLIYNDTNVAGGTDTFTMSGGTISGNTSAYKGGGLILFNDNGSVYASMSGGTISGNTASDNGGGVYVDADSTFTMTGGTITNNQATNSSGTSSANGGGGVYMNGGTFTMSGSAVISENTAYAGAGVNVGGGSFTMNGGTIDGNISTSTGTFGGGGVYVKDDSSAVFTMNDGIISNNTCPYSGAGVHSQGTFVMTGGTISGNEVTGERYSGGGVCVDRTSASASKMTGGKIIGNKAANTAGGVSIYKSTFTMEGGEISGNSAPKGGGVDANGTSSDRAEFVMSGGMISGNEATGDVGGGVYINIAYFTMSGGAITDNQSAGSGGGVSVSSSAQTCTISGGAVSGNTGAGVTDNVNLASGKYITLGTDLSTVPATLAASGASNQIGVTTATDPTKDTPVAFTTTESGTEYYATSASYFFSDKGYGVRSNDEGKYLELYVIDAESFEADYLTGDDGILYTSATADNYLQILSGQDAWANMSQEEKDKVNADLTAANGGETLTYQMLLDQAQAIADEVNAFENSYLGGSDSLYTEATADNYKDILAGASDWADMSDEAKALVNADLTAAWQAAGNEGELTYDDLLAQAFELAYLTDEDGNGPYTEVTADNMDQILSGAEDWANMSDEAKAAVNAALQAESGDSSLTYDDLLADAFQQKYLTDDSGSGPYTEATADNYEQILAGADDWDAMSDEAKAAVNAALTEAWQAAGNTGELTYEDLLAQAQAFSAAADFIYSYVSDSDPDDPYLAATAGNYAQILSGEDAWNAMSEAEQAAVNAILTAANGGTELTYPMLLAQAKAMDFEEKYLTDENGNGPYTAATLSNMDQILAGADDWNAMSDEEKAAVNAALTEANGGVPLTYDELLAQAFMLKYLTDEDGNLYTGVNADNYLKILSGADDWNRLSPEAQALVNMYLTAAWQDEGNEGELTYPMLLEEAEAFAASLGNVKTGDSTRLYLYVILAAAAAAAAAAGAAVSRRRRV